MWAMMNDEASDDTNIDDTSHANVWPVLFLFFIFYLVFFNTNDF